MIFQAPYAYMARGSGLPHYKVGDPRTGWSYKHPLPFSIPWTSPPPWTHTTRWVTSR